jgi:hypothetical protein
MAWKGCDWKPSWPELKYEYYPSILQKQVKKTSVRIVVPVEIRTGHLPNPSQKCSHLSQRDLLTSWLFLNSVSQFTKRAAIASWTDSLGETA